MNGAYFAPGKAYRANKKADGLGAEQDEILPRRNKIQPTSIAGDMASREARSPLKFKDFRRVPLDAVAAASEGCFGEHKNSWLDPTIREALEKTAKVLLWDGDKKTLEPWSQKMLRWRKDHAFRFDDKQQQISSSPRSTTRASRTESLRHIIAKICQRMSSGATLPDVSWVTLIVLRRCGISAPFQTLF